MDVPEDTPAVCPVCEVAYDSVSQHDSGLMVNLLDNERYRRVCFEPVEGESAPVVRFYHHTHEQVGSKRAATTHADGSEQAGNNPVSQSDDTE